MSRLISLSVLLPASCALIAAAALSGCAATASASVSTPAPTVTATVTATPTPVAATLDSPITAAEAWSVCWGAQLGYVGSLDSLTKTWNKYSPAIVTPKGTGFNAQIRGTGRQSDETNLSCLVSGTFGHPVITDYTYQR
jgi:hypothetical protein